MLKSGILGIGVATMDIYIDRKRMYPGGNEYNVACNAAFQGARAGFLGVFADDKAGEILEKTLEEKGVITRYSHHEHGSSGYSLVQLKEDGDRVFLDWNKQGVTDLYPIQFSEEELAYVKTYEVVSLGRCASVSLDRIAYLASQGVDICYDFHAAYTDEDIDTYAPYTTYAFFSCSHLSLDQMKATLKRATDQGVKIAIGTRGSESVWAYDGEEYYEQPVFKVKPLDALGAGDSYIGAFLANYLRIRGELAISGKEKDAEEAIEIDKKGGSCKDGVKYGDQLKVPYIDGDNYGDQVEVPCMAGEDLSDKGKHSDKAGEDLSDKGKHSDRVEEDLSDKEQKVRSCIIQKSLELAARHSAGVVMIEGSIGVGYDVEVEELPNLINDFYFCCD